MAPDADSSLCQSYQKALRHFQRFLARRAPEPLTASVTAFLATLTPAYARAAHSALRAQYPTGVEWATLPRLRRWERNAARLRRTVLSDAEYARLQTARLTVRERALLALLHVVRRAEVATLRWRDVDLDTGSVYVHHGKGGRAGWTVLPPTVVPAVRAWHRETGAPAPDCLVFSGPDGTAVSPDSVGRWVRHALARAGVQAPYRGAHAFRRTFATAFLRSNPEQLRSLQVLMRHRNIATTVLYDYPNPQDYAAALGKLPLRLT